MESIKNKKIIDGVGKDAEIVTNAAGGKQSKSPMAMHLVDPYFLQTFAKNKAEELEYIDDSRSTKIDDEDASVYYSYRAIEYIAHYMMTGEDWFLLAAMDALELDELLQITKIAKVLQYGASRYEPNNWRLIPEEEHINHALIHILAYIAGDTQDDHIDHALCRLMMAYAVDKSIGFDYCSYTTKTLKN